MNTFIYIVWALLPFSLLIFAINASLKKASKLGGRENIRDYLEQAGYATFVLLLAIGFDKFFFRNACEYFGIYGQAQVLIGWLIYPIFLWLAVSLEKSFRGKKEKR